MPQYKYIALNQENKKLAGVINAANETAARDELNNLGFAIVSIEESVEDSQTSTTKKPKFKFEALDKSGKNIIGTIPSATQKDAYQRLIEEYNFQILAIYPPNANEAAIQKAREIEIHELKANYDASIKQKENQSETYKTMTYEDQRSELLKKIDQILQRYQKFIQTFELELKPEPRGLIKKQSNKLARVKTSKSLEYIRQTAEEFLKQLQEQEIFLHEDRLIAEKNKLKIETRKLLTEIHSFGHERRPLKGDIIHRLEAWQDKNITHNPKPTLWAKFLNPTVSRLLNILLDNETVHQLKKQIKTTEEYLKSYGYLWFTTVGPYKEDATRNLKALWLERKHLKKDLIKAKKEAQKSQAQQIAQKPTIFRRILKELSAFSGWLLAFYLIYYFLSNYFLTKNLGFTPPWHYQLFQAHLFKYVLIILFIFHNATSFNLTFFRHNFLASLVLYPLSIAGSLLIIYNL